MADYDKLLQVPRGTKARLEEIKLDLLVNTIVYATDTKELGIKLSDGNIEYFMNATDINAIVNALETSKQDKLVAGTNITIDENTNMISATGNIGITVNWKDVENKPELQDKLVAGDNITIDEITNVISASGGSIVDLGTFDDEMELITYAIMNQLPTGHYTCIMHDFPFLMLLTDLGYSYIGVFYAGEASLFYVEVTKYGEIQELQEISLRDLSDLRDYVDGAIIQVDNRVDGVGYDITQVYGRVDDLDTSKQEKLVAGDNITIDENTNVISASGEEFTQLEKSKLATIEQGAEVNKVNSVNDKVGTVVISADDVPFDGSSTNYLTIKTEVEGAVKELDTQVKTNADNVALKVNTSDIVNNLTSTDIDKPLSANQGKVLKDTVDLLDTRVDDLELETERLDDEVIRVEQKVDVHIEDLDNPHGVTAEQVDTYVKTTIDNKDAAVLQQAKDYTYDRDTIDNKDANTLQEAKDYTYSQVEIDNKDTAIMNKANNLENDKVDKTTTIIGLGLQDNILIGEFRAALGNATQSVAGLLSAEDKTHLDGLVALLETDDDNNVVDTIGEVLAIFESYPEGADLVTALQGKVDKVEGKGLSTNDFTDEYKDKVDNQLTIGDSATQAGRGDYVKTAYSHSQSTHAPSDAQKNSDITKAEIEAKLTGQITSHSHALPAHTHTKSQITDFPTSMPPTAHNHDSDYYKKSETYSKTEIDQIENDTTNYVDAGDSVLSNRLDDVESRKQDKLVAGDNITIDENTNEISTSVVSIWRYE